MTLESESNPGRMPRNRQNPEPIVLRGRVLPLSALNTLRGGDKDRPGSPGSSTWTLGREQRQQECLAAPFPLGSLGGTPPEFLEGESPAQ